MPETLLQNKRRGMRPTQALLQSTAVQAALERMLPSQRRRGGRLKYPNRFWSSRAMLLRLNKDELRKLPQEVGNIQSIWQNRHLTMPSVVETRRHPLELEELLVSTWGLERVKALSVWGSYGARGAGVTIGLLDTGVDAGHPDLQGRISQWAEFGPLGNEIAGSTPHDTHQHGTHCAGTLVGNRASGRFIGMAPEAKVAAALVLNGEEGGTDAQVLAGIDWALEQGVDVLNLSLGGFALDAETPPTYTEAILTCLEMGIPVVAAIGNEGQQTTGSPGNDLFALSIGATDARDRVAGFSGGRTQIIRESEYIDPDFLPLPYSKPDLSAPGVGIYSCVPGGQWSSFSGTSMATPHVAGAIALLLSATAIREKERGIRRAYLIQDLIAGAVEDLGEAGQDHRFGFGRLDILRAIDLARDRGY
jgi:subtilisin family serine protease